MKRPRYIVYWSCEKREQVTAWPVCAGHREAVIRPLLQPGVKETCPEGLNLVVERVSDGICALAAFGTCADEPIEAPSCLGLHNLERDSL